MIEVPRCPRTIPPTSLFDVDEVRLSLPSADFESLRTLCQKLTASNES